jgi:hypothetical protein
MLKTKLPAPIEKKLIAEGFLPTDSHTALRDSGRRWYCETWVKALNGLGRGLWVSIDFSFPTDEPTGLGCDFLLMRPSTTQTFGSPLLSTSCSPDFFLHNVWYTPLVNEANSRLHLAKNEVEIWSKILAQLGL